MKLSINMRAVLLQLLIILAFLAVIGGPSTRRAEAQTLSACNLNHESTIEIGLVGSGKPQRVHQTWRITSDCKLVLTRNEQTINSGQSAQALLDACTNVQIEHVMDTAAGSDRTRLDLASHWCYDGSAITWWGASSVNRWAGFCHTVLGGDSAWFWDSWPWQARDEAYGNYDEVCLSDVGQHTLFNRITLYGDGGATCYTNHWGSFIPGYDIDVQCYYF
jgi:hypothetical protein